MGNDALKFVQGVVHALVIPVAIGRFEQQDIGRRDRFWRTHQRGGTVPQIAREDDLP